MEPAPISADQPDAGKCPEGQVIRLMVDNSASMRGFLHKDLGTPGLRDVLGGVRNEIEMLARTRRDLKDVRFEYMFLGVGRDLPAAARTAASPSDPRPPPTNRCGKPGDCPGTGKTCCSASGTVDEAMSCRPSRECGFLRAADANAWNSPSSYDAVQSKVTSALPRLFDECVHTAVLVTDGLESPSRVGLEYCASGSRTPPRDPGLLPLLQSLGSDGWGGWLMRALLPFKGQVFLECGIADEPMRKELGTRLPPDRPGIELSYTTRAAELQPAMVLVVTRGGDEFAHALGDGLAERVRAYRERVGSASSSALKFTPSLAALQLWPPEQATACGSPKLEARASSSDGIPVSPSGPLSVGTGEALVARVISRATPDDPSLLPLFPNGSPSASLTVDGWSKQESEAFYHPLPTDQDGVPADTQALARSGERHCGRLASRLMESTWVPWSESAGTWHRDFLLVPECVRKMSTQRHRARKDSRSLLSGAVEIRASLTCDRELSASATQVLQSLDGRRWTEDQRTRGIPGAEALTREVVRWARSMEPTGSRLDTESYTLIHRGR